MGFLIGLFTVVMVLDCLVLILLVLIQLPKKEAGMGLAFGGAATDALFGAGSGNVLTKITKYAATAFFVLAVVLSVMQRHYHNQTTNAFEQKLQQATPPSSVPVPPTRPPSATPAPSPGATIPSAVAPGTNVLMLTPPAAESTNLPVPIPAAPAPTTTPKQ